jgi:hypothetical protein
MQAYFEGPARPLYELFGAWWIGAFCSAPEHFVLIQNLPQATLLGMVVRGCTDLGEDAKRAAHAAIPFVLWLRSRDPHPVDQAPYEGDLYEKAVRALEAVEKLGSAAMNTARWQGE